MKISIYQVVPQLSVAFGHAETVRKNAESIVISVEYKGIRAIGECAPREYVTGETLDRVFNTLQIIPYKNILRSIDQPTLIMAIDAFIKWDLNKLTSSNNATCALELLFLDWLGQRFKIPVCEILYKFYFGASKLKEDLVFKTSQVLDLAIDVKYFLENRAPFHTVKIKVDGDLEKNIERVSKIRSAIGKDVPIIVDANMSWTLSEAIRQINYLKKYDISFFEEPLKKGAFKEYAILKKITELKILLDESVCSADDALVAIRLNACDAFNVRISKCGGIRNALDIVRIARINNLQFQIGAQVAEVGPLIAAGRHLRSIVDDAITFEAGQPERWFRDYLVTPMPLVDRSTNLTGFLLKPGLGVELTRFIKSCSEKMALWNDKSKRFTEEHKIT
ncbi:MAG: enolase C-terminal domain-like protein [Gammaproteobacteria bacterium]